MEQFNKRGKLGLYDHNYEAYQKIVERFKTDNIAAIIQAVGTGKSYIAAELIHDYKDSNSLYIVPTNGIEEYLKENVLSSNEDLDFETDFKNLKIITYQKLTKIYKKSFINDTFDMNLYASNLEEEGINPELIIIDEFHHIGAEIWGEAINKLIELKKDAKVLGMTATPVRNRGHQNERSMVDPNSNELFSNKVCSEYTLEDAIIDGVLPVPRYTTANILVDLDEEEQKSIMNDEELRAEYLKLKNDILRYNLDSTVESSKEVSNALINNLTSDGKFIYFCPIQSDIAAIKSEFKNWIKTLKTPVYLYETTADMQERGKINRKLFANDKYIDESKNIIDVQDSLRVMFAINQYNEGIHAPKVTGCIMGRATMSDIVFYQQLGRALSVNNNLSKYRKVYESLSDTELEALAKKNGIDLNQTYNRDDLIDLLTGPIIIDLADNIDYIIELEESVNRRLEERRLKEENGTRTIRKTHISFGIDPFVRDVYRRRITLRGNIITKIPLEERITLMEEYRQTNNNEIINKILMAYMYIADRVLDKYLAVSDYVQEIKEDMRNEMAIKMIDIIKESGDAPNLSSIINKECRKIVSTLPNKYLNAASFDEEDKYQNDIFKYLKNVNITLDMLEDEDQRKELFKEYYYQKNKKRIPDYCFYPEMIEEPLSFDYYTKVIKSINNLRDTLIKNYELLEKKHPSDLEEANIGSLDEKEIINLEIYTAINYLRKTWDIVNKYAKNNGFNVEGANEWTTEAEKIIFDYNEHVIDKFKVRVLDGSKVVSDCQDYLYDEYYKKIDELDLIREEYKYFIYNLYSLFHKSIEETDYAYESTLDVLSDISIEDFNKVLDDRKKSLTEVEKEMFDKYYMDRKNLTQIAKEYGISIERARQKVCHAARKVTSNYFIEREKVRERLDCLVDGSYRYPNDREQLTHKDSYPDLDYYDTMDYDNEEGIKRGGRK